MDDQGNKNVAAGAGNPRPQRRGDLCTEADGVAERVTGDEETIPETITEINIGVDGADNILATTDGSGDALGDIL